MRGLLRADGLRSALRRLRDSERGQGLVEYALIIVVVSLGTIAALTFLRDNIRGLFSAAGSSIALGAGTGGSTGTGTGGGTSAPAYVSGASISCTNPHSNGVCNDSPETMTVDPGTWTGSPAPTFTYTWWYNPSASATTSNCLTTNPGNAWSQQPSTTANSGTLPNIDDSNGQDSMKVIVTASNSDPGSPVSVAFCRIFEN